ncbi:hypothetical protein [Actinomadura oligospora]|uniref:hypothetical protein n=1 Tax=Actinomadura oligospora TaxID=111804 RepID=UPI000479D140|nr:hypothetical protein [Actinomadura oligospora]
MASSTFVPVTLGVMTAAVALVGYWSNLFMKRREARGQMYAEALQVIHRYEELPYMIRYRPASDSQVRADLGERISEVFLSVSYYQTLLTMDSRVVGEAYAELYKQTRRGGGPHRKEAWSQPPMESDTEASGQTFFPYDNAPELECCLLAMRRELTPLGRLLRPLTRRSVQARLRERPQWEEPAWMRQRRADLESSVQPMASETDRT